MERCSSQELSSPVRQTLITFLLQLISISRFLLKKENGRQIGKFQPTIGLLVTTRVNSVSYSIVC